MKKFYKKNWIWFLILLVPYVLIILSLTIKVNFSADMPGGLSNLNKEIEIENGKKLNGSISSIYVNDQTKISIFNFLIDYFSPYSTLYMLTEQEVKEYDAKSEYIIGTIDKNSSYNNSVIAAYSKLLEDGEDIEFNYEIIPLVYGISSLVKERNNSFNYYSLYNKKIVKVGNTDIVVDKTSETPVTTQIQTLINEGASECACGEAIDWVLENDNGIEETYSIEKVDTGEVDSNGDKICKFGITYYMFYTVTKANPSYKINEVNTIGPSGGLMQALYIYASLSSKDITKGLKIAGTGTIDYEGNAGAIGGVKQKVISAALAKADVFFVPNTSYGNYEVALQVKEKLGLKIEIVPVKSLNDVLEYLEGLS